MARPSRQIIAVALPYPVIAGPGCLADAGEIIEESAPAHRYAIITDSNVGPLYGKRVLASLPERSAHVLTVPAGEAHKTRETWARLTDELLALRFGRDTTIVALGGGVVGDLAGFVAATFMRGVPVVQIPTTLLSMIDASIGGKTGVDTPAGKNLVGAFHPPAAVIADTQTLATLPLDELRQGLAEALKHGVIADEGYFDFVAAAIPELVESRGSGSDSLVRLVVRSIEIKSDIVRHDPGESGLRKVLNFGHTVGHAVEMWSGYRVAHGAAVAIGMVVESSIAELAGVAEGGTARRVRAAVERAGLPATLPSGMKPDELLHAMLGDKKVKGGAIEYALPKRIGEMAGSESGWTVSVNDELVREVLI
ncbi:MAG: 3-dehydroquinate synthase [Gemmatimonadaceae bacterium]|nr:3-dehydroquinate synthase [Gemmatimonadaceae bacterium]